MLAAISLFDLDALPPTLNPTIGAVTKHTANPLLVQDTPWEPRLDNGYPNVVEPGPDSPSWQLWYGDCVKGCGTQILLYANSTDGLTWVKPPLGLFDVGSVRDLVARWEKTARGSDGEKRDGHDDDDVSDWAAYFDTAATRPRPAGKPEMFRFGAPPPRREDADEVTALDVFVDLSLSLLGVEYIDLFSFHGINTEQ